MESPRLVMAALRGGSGKTILSIGIIASWKRQGKTVLPFKKGPDYIDAGWLALAASQPCFNLDTFLMSDDIVRTSFKNHAHSQSVALIEGNRGLYDGLDEEGTTSTAELAKLLTAPVILCIDCTKATRTMAAAVLGCLRFDPEVQIKGVILNRVAGGRHETILRRSIEHYCGIPVLGAVPKLGKDYLLERQKGLIPVPEYEWVEEAIEAAARMAERYLDLEALLQTAVEAKPLPKDAGMYPPKPLKTLSKRHEEKSKPRIGVLKDSAFQFYYPENLEAITSAGGQTVFISPLSDESLPPLDALYIGGGFLESYVERLALNTRFKDEIKALVERGLPVYAECGGLMYLSNALMLEKTLCPMAGVLPITLGFSKRPQGHGYTVVSVEKANPYYAKGLKFRGHEFHYLKVLAFDRKKADLVFRMEKGAGLVEGNEGIFYKNVLATCTYIHALGVPQWGESLVRMALAFQASSLSTVKREK